MMGARSAPAGDPRRGSAGRRVPRRAIWLGALAVAAGVPAPSEPGSPGGGVRRIGLLNPGPAPGTSGVPLPSLIPALLEGLRALGWVEGQTIAIEAGHAAWQLDRLPVLANALVRGGVEVLVVMGPVPMEAARAAARASSRPLPVVMVASSHDPVADGYAASLSRPGGNVTGLTFAVSEDLVSKHFQLLRDAVPALIEVAWLWDGPPADYQARWAPAIGRAARQLGLRATPAFARTPGEVEAFFAAPPSGAGTAVVVAMAGVTFALRGKVAEWAARARRPTMAYFREFPEAGGLMSYGPDLREVYRRAAAYVDRLLRGAPAAELPIENPSRFELVINLLTARRLALNVPAVLRVQATDLLE